MKTVLVTGGAGFIGSHLSDKLTAKGFSTVILDNLTTGKKSYIPKKAVFYKGDVKNIADVESVFQKHRIDVVFHIAGQASTITSFSDPSMDVSVNFNGTMNITLSCVKYKVPRLLFASSMVAYGHPKHLPIEETQPCIPISYYGITKYTAERFVHATAQRNDLKSPLFVTSFRMFNVYGPRQSLTNPYQGAMAIFIGNVMRNEPITIYGDGKQARDFVYIDDVVDAWINAADNKRTFGNIYNIGYGKMVSINSLIAAIVASFGKDPASYPIRYGKERPGDQRFMEADISFASKDIGFHPQIPLEEGLRRTIAWAKQTTRKKQKQSS